MNISSSLSFNTSISQIFSSNDKKASVNYDTALAQEANYPTQKPAEPIQNSNKQQDTTVSSNSGYEQFVYAPNISALFNAYLDRQKLDQSSDTKKKELTDRLANSGMERNAAKNYAENGVEFYKQMMEAQYTSKINSEVQKQDELKQMLSKSSSPNPYIQMTGSLISLYS